MSKKSIQELKMELGGERARAYLGKEKDGVKQSELPDEHRATINLLMKKYGSQVNRMQKDGDFNLDNGHDIVVDSQGVGTVNSPSTGYKGTIDLNTPKITRNDRLVREMHTKYSSR